MLTFRSGIIMGLVTAAFLAGGCATAPSDSAKSAAPADASTSLQACLDRIPAGATVGQRMIAEERCQKAEEARSATVGAGTPADSATAASGTSGDSLEACLARIPKDASAGQRMIAEESCQRDAEAKKAMTSAP